MSKIIDVIEGQGQDITKMKKFIKKFGDDTTYSRWGYFDTYGRSTFLHIEVCGEYIVYVHENSQYESGYKVSSGIGHKITLHARDVEMTKVWDFGRLLSYRDQYDQRNDRQGPYPKKIVDCVLNADGSLSVIALMPSDEERVYTLSLRLPKS